MATPLEDTFRQLADCSSEPCWILGPDQVVHLNAAMQALGPLQPADLAACRERMRGDEPFELELRQRWQTKAVPLRDGSDRWFFTARRSGLLASLFQGSFEPSMAWWLSPRRMTAWNRGAERLFGLSAADALGRDPHELLPLAGPEAELSCDGHWMGQVPWRERSLEVTLQLVELPEGRLVLLTAKEQRALAGLGEDLLDLARVARGQNELHRQPVALAQLIEEALQGWPEQQPRPALALADGLQVDVDEHRLGRALLHLLRVVSRHARAGQLALSAQSIGKDVLLKLKGVPYLDRARGELDLSLSLVRDLTELHGGRAEVQGDQLVLALPEATTRPLRVLVVEDNEDAAYLLSILLESAGHEVRVANDPHLALSITETFLPDVAILDIGLPVMDGYELGTRLRAKLQPHKTQLIALSGYGQAQDRQRSADAGFGVHLVKPVDPDHLLGLVNSPHAG